MTQPAALQTGEYPHPGWRFWVGLIVLVTGFASPALIPVVTGSGLSTAWKTALSSALAVGIPEVFTLAAIAIMGRSGFDFLKAKAFGWLKQYGPADRVSRARYRTGLVLFTLPLLFAWIVPYGPHLVPWYDTHRMAVNLAGDLMLVASLFVLGGNFWDKLRALFVHQATVSFPSQDKPLPIPEMEA